MLEPRYAIYYAPPETSPLWRLGSRWLSRDAVNGEIFARFELEGFEESQVKAFTEFPRFYGLHATLKPPFRLAHGKSLEDLDREMDRFAARQSPFVLPNFQLDLLGSFIAVTLAEPSPDLSALADAAVRDLDEFRRPPSQAELEKRRKGLSPRQNEFLDRWGYPYVFQEWQFHMSLASGLSDHEVAKRLLHALQERFRPALADRFVCDSVCIYRHESPADPFVLHRRFPFGS